MEKIKIKKKIKIVMPSSLIQQNFGENVSKHGYLLWDVEDRTFTEHDVQNENSYYTIKIKSLEDLDNDKEIISNL